MTDQERTQALFKLREMMRTDPEITFMAKAIAAHHGGDLARLLAEDPTMFDVLCEEVASIITQLGVEEQP